jgi:hypothetical protein
MNAAALRTALRKRCSPFSRYMRRRKVAASVVTASSKVALP